MTTNHKNRHYRPPKAVVNNALRGLELKRQWARGGVNAASNSINKGASAGLADGNVLPWGDIKELKKFFDNHPDGFAPEHLESDGGPNENTIDWLICGGSACRDWVNKLSNQHEEEDMSTFNYRSNILKVDDSLGLVLGWAIISKKDGEDYYDLQKDHIPEDAMLKASVDFMQGQRVVGDMHSSEEGGQVVFAWPMTSDIAKAFGLKTTTTGLMVAIKPKNQKTLEKFKDGTYNGFSIGGERLKDEEVDNA